MPPIYVLCFSSHFWPFTKANFVFANFTKKSWDSVRPPPCWDKIPSLAKDKFLWLPLAEEEKEEKESSLFIIFFVQIVCCGDLQISADVIYEKKPAMNEIRNIWQQSFGATANRTYELKWQRSRPSPVVSNQNPGRKSIYKYKVYCWRKDARHRQHNTSFCFLNVKNFFFYYWKCSTTASQ